MLRLSEPYPAYVVDRLGLVVRINPDIAKSVVFVGIDGEFGFTPIATGALVGYSLDDEFFLFVLTAAHAVEDLSDASRSRLAVRVNKNDGSSEPIRLDVERRATHPNPATDMVLFGITLNVHTYDFRVNLIDRKLFEGARQEYGGVMPGDSVCAVGLYTSHHGAISNTPVVRTGNIAAVVNEPVLTARGYIGAYLIELRTIAGLSGSPVFQTAPFVRNRNGVAEIRTNDAAEGAMLGLLVGYHLVVSKDDQILVPQFGAQTASADHPLSADERNTGFGVVVPIECVCDFLEMEVSQAALRGAIKERRDAGYRQASEIIS